MNCDQYLIRIPALVDGELDAQEQDDVTSHLSGCHVCQAKRLALVQLREAIQACATRPALPPHLPARIVATVLRKPASKWALPAGFWLGFGSAASIGSACLLCLWLVSGPLRSERQDVVFDQVITNHASSLLLNHLLDIASSDRHMVKPWLNGKITYAPPTADLSADGFPLAGARLTEMNGRVVVALVYRRREHVINTFVWPISQSDSGGEHEASARGFHSVAWSAAGMRFWAISDLNRLEMQAFRKLMAEKTLMESP